MKKKINNKTKNPRDRKQTTFIKAKLDFFEKTTRIDKPLTRMIKKKRYKLPVAIMKEGISLHIPNFVA